MSKKCKRLKRQHSYHVRRRSIEKMITSLKSRSDLNLFTQGSVYWYENPYNDKEDYNKFNKNQDFISTRPVVIVEKAVEIKGFSLNSVIIAPISTSPKRVGIHINMGNEYDCKILPYNISAVKVKYLKDYKGHISKELLNELLQAIDYHLGRTTEIPQYIKNFTDNKSFNNGHENSEFSKNDIIMLPSIIEDDHPEDDGFIINIESEESDESSSNDIKIHSRISLNKKYNDIYETVHPITKIEMNKMSVSEIKSFFNKYNMAWDTAKRIKMKIAEEINSVGFEKYCVYCMKNRINAINLNLDFKDKIKFMTNNDKKLFNFCTDTDINDLLELSLEEIISYKKQFSLELHKTDEMSDRSFDDSILKIKDTEKFIPV